VATALSPAVRARLDAYLAEIEHWNRRLSLSAVPLAEAWHRHIEESLHLLEVAVAEPGSTVVDVGSGAGVPGVVVAAVRPDLRVSLLEADTRKQGFLTHVAGLLGLGNITVLGMRAEDGGRDAELREHFDLALSRAAAPSPVLCELALPLLRVGGRLGALVGDATREAVACSRAAAACGGAEPECAARWPCFCG
jgi:16S rRNA (guanine527-N7)-methyltransferase